MSVGGDGRYNAVMRDDGRTVACTVCGESMTLDLPMEVSLYAERVGAFAREHSRCKATDQA